MLKITRSSEVLTPIAIGANNNKVAGSNRSLNPNLFKVKKSYNFCLSPKTSKN